MMNGHSYSYKIVFGILTTFLFWVSSLAAVFFLGRCSAKKDGGGDFCNAGTYYVTPIAADTFYVPTPKDTVFVPVPANVDTAAIVGDYYLQKVYRDTVLVAVASGLGRDSAEAVITDTVWQNGIAGRELRLTFYPKRLVKEHSVGLISTFGYNNLTVMAEYRYRMMKMYAGYNIIDRAPVAGIGFQLFNW